MSRRNGGNNYVPDVRAVVVAQLVEWSLPTPEIHSSNPDIGKILSTKCMHGLNQVWRYYLARLSGGTS